MINLFGGINNSFPDDLILAFWRGGDRVGVDLHVSRCVCTLAANDNAKCWINCSVAIAVYVETVIRLGWLFNYTGRS